MLKNNNGTEIDLIDIGGGNLGSVIRCLDRLNIAYRKTSYDNPPDGSRPLLLPGVGAFGAVMNYLKKDGLDQLIKNLVQNGTPYLGICVGMQILFNDSEESGGIEGLGLIGGNVLRLPFGKVPQIGWNLVNSINDRPRESGRESGYVYFVNSYYGNPNDAKDILLSANYHIPFCAALKKDNITAFQFHPEKSGQYGENLLWKWVKDVSK